MAKKHKYETYSAADAAPVAGLVELPQEPQAPAEKPTATPPVPLSRWRVKHPYTGSTSVEARSKESAVKAWAERYFPAEAADPAWLEAAAKECRVAEIFKSKIDP